MKELLEQLAKGEVTTDEVLAKIDESDKDKVPRSRLNDKIEDIKDLQEQIKERDKQLQELGEKTKGNEELEGKLNELKEENSKWEAKYQQSQIDTAIKLAAKDAKDPADVLVFVKKETLKLNEDGTVSGLDEALSGLKESKPYLFTVEDTGTLAGRKPNTSNQAPTTGMTKEDFGKLSYSEKVALFTNEPDTYNKLKGD